MVYWLLWSVGHVLSRLLYRVSYSGGGNVPRQGPVLVCANHMAWWDPVILAMSIHRRIHFIAKAELFRSWPLGLVLKAIGAFPVRRGEPDRKSISQALDLLTRGEAVGIFPEGTRTRTGAFRRAEPGVGFLILRSGAPVIPAYFDGPYRYQKPIRLTVGPLVRIGVGPEAGRSGAEKRQAAADAVMMQIAALGGRTRDYEAILESGPSQSPKGGRNGPVRPGQVG